jgi:F-type H+-transporting ATPase subunit b
MLPPLVAICNLQGFAMLDINLTLFIQLANFLITMAALNFLLIRPVRDMIKKRRALASKLLQEADSFAQEAEKRLDGYEKALAEARRKGAASRDAKKEEGMGQESAILARAREEASLCRSQ